MAYQINVIDKFFEKHNKVDINKLSSIKKISHPLFSQPCLAHPILELLDTGDKKQKINESRIFVLFKLLAHGVSPNLNDKLFVAPLSVAVKTKDLMAAKLLLNHGANPNSQDANEIPVLFTAAANLDMGMIKLLTKFKANVNIKIKNNKNYPKLKNHNVLAYLYRSISNETPDSVNVPNNANAEESPVIAIIKLLHKEGVSLKAKLGDNNKTLKQLIETFDKNGVDKYGNAWGRLLNNLNQQKVLEK